MSVRDYLEIGLFTVILLLATKPLGIYMDRVFDDGPHPLKKVLGWLEQLVYRIGGINPDEGQPWTRYTRDLLGLSIISLFFTYAILRFQHLLPLNPQKLGPLSPDAAFQIAMSFTTNTNWQFYTGESTMSYLSQMVALVIHNFFSAAVGIAVAVAVVRGIASKGKASLGNFWADFVRCNLYILLPICFVYSIFLVSQGILQNFEPYVEATTLESVKQIIAMGPTASQVAIKMLGTNGGGFFNANAAHPFENPTSVSNFLQMLSIFLIPSALVYMLGRKVSNMKHAWSVWAAMAVLFIAGVIVCGYAEYSGNPLLARLGCSSPANMEGKEVRFGIFESAFFATVTTDASCGAVNSMHDSFTPLGGLVPMFNIKLGEIVFGGVGAGLYTMVLFIVLTIFISGLMVGRTPEYLGKKIEGREVKYAMLSLIIGALSILGFSAWAILDYRGLAGISNAGPHGLSEILYAYASSTGNNGSAFAGLNGNTFYNITLALAMMVGRFFMMIPVLAIAGSLAEKTIHPESEGTFPAHGVLFTGLLIGVIIIVGALTFFPTLSLGPIAEHFEMLRGKLF
jgi:K+-transporting ATPase ATPase A chain